MRITLATIVVLATLLPGVTATAAAQTGAQAPPERMTGAVDFGVRFTDVSGDTAKWQRFRDLGDGVYVQSFKLNRSGVDWKFQATAANLGRDDQRYTLSFKSRGRLNVSFSWDQIPLWVSNSTATLYTGIGTGTLRIADNIQQSTQLAAGNLANFIGGAQKFNLRSRRNVAKLDVVFSPTGAIDVIFNLKNTSREGTQPYGAYLLQPIEVPLPVDTRTTDVGTSLQWTSARGRLGIGYQGSWFDNRVPTFIWDNPWRFDDSSSAGAGQGRMALWPDNTLHALTASGAVKAAGRTNLTASVTFGRASQNEALLPFTINTQIVAPALPRQTADAQVRNTAANIALTSRPHPWLWMSARWRYYDSNNRMPDFGSPDYIRADQRVSVFEPIISTAPLSFSRNNVDLDLSVTPRPFAALRVGYSRNGSTWENRIFSEAVEDVVRASVDATPVDWLTFRGIVEHAERTGSGFRLELLQEFEEQPDMRHFDIADRDRTRFTALVQVTPGSVFGASASVSKGKDEYNDAKVGAGGFGLKSYENRRYSLSIDLTPTEQVSAGVWFVRENYAAFQRSRTASAAQFTDPQRDWMLDTDDKVDTISAELDLRQIRSKLDVRLGYQTSRAGANYVHSAVNSTVIGVPQRLPEIRNILDSGTLDMSWPLTDRLGLGVVYRYDRYEVKDFLLDESFMTRLDLAGGMFLGYVYRPYTANGIWLRLNYRW
jgi:MtrB/PioB family decaheme-associated outer membrane protein